MKKSSDPRHNSRRLALGALFCSLFTDSQNNTCFDLSKELLDLSDGEFEKVLTDRIINGITENRKDIDEIIQECAPDWPIDKISKVDLIILRVAVFEVLYCDDIPDKVVIDEAVELAKEFGGDTSGKFINGVLGTVVEIKEKTKEES